jgi:hypothetical protein
MADVSLARMRDQVRDIERRVALAELLARPDPPDLRCGHRLLLEGRPDRFERLPYLAAALVQARLLDLRERASARTVPQTAPQTSEHLQWSAIALEGIREWVAVRSHRLRHTTWVRSAPAVTSYMSRS